MRICSDIICQKVYQGLWIFESEVGGFGGGGSEKEEWIKGKKDLRV